MNKQLVREVADLSAFITLYKIYLFVPEMGKNECKGLRRKIETRFLILGEDVSSIPNEEFAEYTHGKLRLLYPDQREFIYLGQLFSGITLFKGGKVEEKEHFAILENIENTVSQMIDSEYANELINKIKTRDYQKDYNILYDFIDDYINLNSNKNNFSNKKIREDLIQLVEINNFSKCLNLLKLYYEDLKNKEKLKLIIHLIAQNNRMKMESNLGILSFEEKTLVINNLTNTILNIIDELE